MNSATRASWKTLPLPQQKRPLGLTALFTDSEGELIQRGLVPKQMEDKWFIFFEEGWLYFHRSWKGQCIYWLRLDGSPMGVRIVEGWTNTDPSQHKAPDPEYDKLLVQFLIDAFLLGKSVEFPRLSSVDEAVPGMVQHHFVGRAYPEVEYRDSTQRVGLWERLRRKMTGKSRGE